ncbi:MAG: Endonuclease/Exonuclease/phosphatase family protein [Acidobacteria bacterium]|nr:Endonuclease/Exonuclease/phosphatase family protein [Acidobacteriota bacterium]
MKTKFLFWNLNERPLAHLVRAVVVDAEIDFILLAECDIPRYELLTILNRGLDRQYDLVDDLSQVVVILSRLPETRVIQVLDGFGVSIRRLARPRCDDVVLVAVHLPSKMYSGAGEQALNATRIRRQIEAAEEGAGHRRTVIVGDLNMDPFEPGVVAADALHAVMDRRIAAENSRTVAGEIRHFFYNPMWGRFGDSSAGPPGTYFYNSGGQTNYYWHMFDQVLVRGELVSSFSDADLMVHAEAGDVPLLRGSGRPDGSVGSDHLPLSFALELATGEVQ